MAERRMFAKTIIDSDDFLDMPVTARLLYYDLAMRADDDGFVNSPKKIMKFIGASPDDMSILIMRKFVIPFDSGVVVIRHWRIHNYIRKDTYSETPYKTEKATLSLDENNAYVKTDETILVNDPSTTRPRLVDEPSTQDRIGKDRKGKVREEDICAESSGEASTPPKSKPKKKEYAPLPPPTVDEVKAYCNERGITNVNPQYFVDYYSAAIPPWTKANGEPVKNWKLTVVTWSQHPMYGNQKPQQTSFVPQPDDYPF